MRDGVAHAHLLRCFDAGDDVAHIAGAHLFARTHLELERADLIGIVFASGGHELHHVAAMDDAVDHLEVGDDATEGVEDGVEDEALQRRLGVALWGCGRRRR